MPVGGRRWSEVWRRQVRWGSTRLNLPTEVKALVLFEPAIGWLAAGLAGSTALLAAGVSAGLVALAVVVHTIAWLAAEAWFVTGYGLPFGPRAWVAVLARENPRAGAGSTGLARPPQDRLARHRSGGGLASVGGWCCRKERMMSNAMDDIATIMLPRAGRFGDLGGGRSADVRGDAAGRTRHRRRQRGHLYECGPACACWRPAIHRAAEEGTRIVLCRFSGPAADCLLVSGFSQLFDVAETVEEARKRLRSDRAGNTADRLHRRGTAG